MSDSADKKNKSEFKEDTLKKRYGFKLLSGFLSYGITAIIQLMVPRSLGPNRLGRRVGASFLRVGGGNLRAQVRNLRAATPQIFPGIPLRSKPAHCY